MMKGRGKMGNHVRGTIKILARDAQQDSSEAGDLLPCPFCAGNARIICGIDGVYPPVAECDQCWVRMPAPECLTGKLIAAWNRRALPAARTEVSVAEAVDHEQVRIGLIGNYYGGLFLMRDDGVDYWSIENYDGHRWEVCPAPVAAALRALTEAGE